MNCERASTTTRVSTSCIGGRTCGGRPNTTPNSSQNRSAAAPSANAGQKAASRRSRVRRAGSIRTVVRAAAGYFFSRPEG